MDTLNLKVCKCCLAELDIRNFSKHKLGQNGLRSRCKLCERNYQKEYLKINYKPKTKEQIESNNEYHRKKMLVDPEYKENHLKKKRDRSNSEEYKQKARIQRKKWLETPTNRIAKNMRDRMRSALRGLSKKESTLNMTGISFEELKNYFESKFTIGMTWDNYGNGWHIDHIIPCNFFDFTKEEHQQICFYYKNLQPMWAKENISKGDRINIDNFQSLLIEIKSDLLIND